MSDNYILMHSNKEVAYIRNSSIIAEIFNENELPLCCQGQADRISWNFKTWLKHRMIPNNRMMQERISRNIHPDFERLMYQSMAITMTDTFWLKPEGSSLTWNDVNFHDNGFGNLVSNALFCDIPMKSASLLPHPTFTTDGVLFKVWVQDNGKSYLLKQDKTKEQLIGEIFASNVADMLDIPHVPYTVKHLNRRGYNDEYCVSCGCIVTDSHTDMIHAFEYQNRLHCTRLQLYKILYTIDNAVDKMIAFDTLTGQCDRHFNNFAFIDGKLAPLYDNGRCLSYMTDTKPFVTDKREQLSLIHEIPFELPQREWLSEQYKAVCEEFKEKPKESALDCINESYVLVEDVFEDIDKKKSLETEVER